MRRRGGRRHSHKKADRWGVPKGQEPTNIKKAGVHNGKKRQAARLRKEENRTKREQKAKVRKENAILRAKKRWRRRKSYERKEKD